MPRSKTRFTFIAAFLIGQVVMAPIQAHAQAAVSGFARVVDGDTVHLAVPHTDKIIKVRLQGVAAPERNQDGGPEATQFLEGIAGGRIVKCELDGSKSKDRVVGICYLEDGRDIGAAVIEAGLAKDCPNFSGGRYKALEKPAAAGLPYPSYCEPRRKTPATTAPAPVIRDMDGSVTGPNHLERLASLNGEDALEHGGGLNTCGCHFNRKTGECHCHRNYGCGCACQSPECPEK